MSLQERLKAYFFGKPVPDAIFQVAASYLSAAIASNGGRKPPLIDFVSLEEGVVEPSFDRENLKNVEQLVSKINLLKKKADLQDGQVGVLIPELCLKVQVIISDDIPQPVSACESFVRWKFQKGVPSLPDDVFLAYKVFGDQPHFRFMVAAARRSVIRQYEQAFEAAGLKPGVVSTPIFSLANLASLKSQNDLLVNVESGYVSLLALVRSECFFYRLKLVDFGSYPLDVKPSAYYQVSSEIDNTVHFLEDRDKIKLDRILIRAGFPVRAADLIAELRRNLNLPVLSLDYASGLDLDEDRKLWLAPLFGDLQ